jgi:thymidylate synthase, flavin-dependent
MQNGYTFIRKLDVLDQGYVRLVDHMGSDLSVVNSARVSYDRESRELTEQDIRLIKYLAREGHTSPFRHATLQFEVYAPLMVARQWWKHIIGSDHREPFTAWNESSRRYINEVPAFHIPVEYEWRSTPENKKQGSGEPVDPAVGKLFTQALENLSNTALQAYDLAIQNGICPEQARLFLPAYALYVRWYWTASLQAVCHFLELRLDGHAQKEIQQYAEAVYELTSPFFPVSVEQLLKTA